jgi:[acyl-carrier-protein] S-malonyltransferase
MAQAVVFPGQGTQQPGMGQPWVDHPSWAVVERAEKATGERLAHLLLDATAEELAPTREAQLSVLTTSLVVWDALREELDETPIALAGHSLGQITALIAAGVLELDDGVRLAARRAELTQEAANQRPGQMVALLGATPEQAQALCDAVTASAPDGGPTCWIANDNTVGQIAVAGTPAGIAVATEQAKDLGIKRVMALNVGGAFHTPLMQDAADGLAEELSVVALHDSPTPVVSNEDARPYTDGEGWRSRLVTHLVRPVRWRSVMATLADAGATTFIEVGHGSMIAGLAKRGVPEVVVRNVATPADLAADRS